MRKNNLLSFVVLLNSESIPVHKTILSVLSAVESASLQDVVSISLLDTGDNSDYISVNKNFLEKQKIRVAHQGAKMLSEAIRKSLTGTFGMVLLPGDLISESYLKALAADDLSREAILLPDSAVHYFSEPFHAPIVTPVLNLSQDELHLSSIRQPLYVNGVIFPAKKLGNSPDITSAIWSVVCDNHHTVTINHRSVYCRLHNNPTEYYSLRESNSFLRTKAHRPSIVKTVSIPSSFHPFLRPSKNSRKYRIKAALEPHPFILKTVLYGLHQTNRAKGLVRRIKSSSATPHSLPQWCIDEILSVHVVEPRVFAYKNIVRGHQNFVAMPNHESLFAPALYYRQAVDFLSHDQYDYVLIVPWLIAGGADKFFMNYANTIDKLRPSKKVLVISTEPSGESLPREQLMLHKNVDFLPLAEIIKNTDNYPAFCQHILTKLVAQLRPSVIHVASSLMGFEFIDKNSDYLVSSSIKIVTTGYNEIVDEYGRRQGYVHECIPKSYPYTNLITTDNQKIIDMWQSEYGIDAQRVLMHKQPFDLPKQQATDRGSKELRLLWASHVRKEKNPEMAVSIAKYFYSKGMPVSIDCYGSIDPGHYPASPFAKSTPNLSYKGSFKQIFVDIDLGQYDAFIYTSMFDGTPNILIEMGLAKMPIISSAIGGIPELLRDDAILINDPKDTRSFTAAVSDLLADKQAFHSRAESLFKRLEANNTYPAFEKDIENMLQLLQY